MPLPDRWAMEPPELVIDEAEHAVRHLRNALETLDRILARNRWLEAAAPSHGPSARKRIQEAEQEIIDLESWIGEIEAYPGELPEIR